MLRKLWSFDFSRDAAVADDDDDDDDDYHDDDDVDQNTCVYVDVVVM